MIDPLHGELIKWAYDTIYAHIEQIIFIYIIIVKKLMCLSCNVGRSTLI